MTTGQDSLTDAQASPFIGLTDGEYARLKELGDGEGAERMQLLGKVQTACRPGEFSVDLSIPGQDTANVTFGTPLARGGDYQGFQVTRIDRSYRIADTNRSTWLRWIHWRFPGISLMSGPPTAVTNYEIGPFVATVVLLDTAFELGEPAEYAAHSDCLER
jgi:hypothetical protein